LGGTTEASLLARALVDAGESAVFSYAGRTANPVAQPLPTRVGGFGGVSGLRAYLRSNGISHVVDATHPFAAGMTRNAIDACTAEGIALVGYERTPWHAGPGDRWTSVPDVKAAVDALPQAPTRVFLAIGKQQLEVFAAKPQHHYVLRLVDPPMGLPLPDALAVVARGPFTVDGDLALLRHHAISHIVAKNAGGSGAAAKLQAARQLAVPVILIDRPVVPARAVVDTVAGVLDWLHHGTNAGTERGV